jgi:hypothetical protein
MISFKICLSNNDYEFVNRDTSLGLWSIGELEFGSKNHKSKSLEFCREIFYNNDCFYRGAKDLVKFKFKDTYERTITTEMRYTETNTAEDRKITNNMLTVDYVVPAGWRCELGFTTDSCLYHGSAKYAIIAYGKIWFSYCNRPSLNRRSSNNVTNGHVGRRGSLFNSNKNECGNYHRYVDLEKLLTVEERTLDGLMNARVNTQVKAAGKVNCPQTAGNSSDASFKAILSDGSSNTTVIIRNNKK